MRRICAGVSVGNTCSTRELLSGSPRLTWLIVVFGGAPALPDYLSLFCRDPLKAKYKMYRYKVAEINANCIPHPHLVLPGP